MFDSSIDQLRWTKEALQKLKNIPYFVRTQARQKIEAIAIRNNQANVTVETVEQARLQDGQ